MLPIDKKSEKIKKAIGEFNKYRFPEDKAKLISTNEKFFKIEFTGSFCRTCGFRDYFDDFKIFIEEMELKARVVEINEEDNGAVVTFMME